MNEVCRSLSQSHRRSSDGSFSLLRPCRNPTSQNSISLLRAEPVSSIANLRTWTSATTTPHQKVLGTSSAFFNPALALIDLTGASFQTQDDMDLSETWISSEDLLKSLPITSKISSGAVVSRRLRGADANFFGYLLLTAQTLLGSDPWWPREY